VSASSYYSAIGIYAAGDYGTTVYNSGPVSASSSYDAATGIHATSAYGDVLVDSSGAVSAYAASDSVGIQADADFGNAYVSTSGATTVTAAYGLGTGIYAYSALGYALVDNAGSVDVSSYDSALGIGAAGYYGATVYSTASVSASSDYGDATGIDATSQNGGAFVYSTGSIDASAGGLYGIALGISAQSQGAGDVYVYSGGAIQVDASGAYGSASGIWAYALYGDLGIVNGGAIDAQAGFVATGIYAEADYGDLVVSNSGNIHASAAYDATGIQLQAVQGDISLTNTGAITAVSGSDAAFGIVAAANNGNMTVDNSADIHASAYDYAWGIELVAGGDLAVYNSGDIVVLAYHQGYGIQASAGGDIDLAVAGEVYVVVGSSGAGAAYATGVDVGSASGYVGFDGAAGVFAGAIADSGNGYAYALGVHVDAAYAYVGMGGASSIVADASGYYASAVGLEVNGGYALSLDLGGDISAYASGFYGEAVGVVGSSYLDVDVYNGGDIVAQFSGDYGTATGVRIDTLGDIVLYNAGSILASAAYYAVGVQLDAAGTTTLFNEGLIAAYTSAGYGVAVVSGDADDLVLNQGTIDGAVRSGDGDDVFVNELGATWNVDSAFDSYFGAGDDGIYNAGTINLSDATIDLGLPGAGGNYVRNYGLITVSGDNLIDLEGGSAARVMDAALAVPSSNPAAFYNYGVIDFQDGVPDDTLTVVGDFAGDGSLLMDISGLNNTGDLLYIDGSVASGSVNIIDIDLLDLPQDDGFALVPVVEVAGDSVSGNFVLGSVAYTPIPFIDTSISLVSNINSANTSPDLFSLQVAMNADESGAIAAVLPAGVQLLMNDVVGSWHKRVEGIEDNGKSKFSLWARLYYNKGKVCPDSEGDVGGDFCFDQKNTGGEAGLDFAPNGKFSFGLILGRANADQNLRLGFGTDKIQGNVTGGYGTYKLPRGFYFDISHRRLKFDAELDTPNGPMTASGEAKTSNAESGYSFNIAGFEVEGQVQLTHTKLTSLDALTFDPSSTSTSSLRMLSKAAAVPPEFENDPDLSSVKRVGVDVRKKWKSKTGTLWELHWTSNRIRETGGRNSFVVNNTLGGSTDIGGDSSLIDVGFTARRGLLLYYGALTWQDGGVLQNFFGAQLGAKFTW
jgi:hypothetical protein